MPPHKRDPHDRAGIIATAAGILDAYGLADLTMRRLARELDVTAGALYWHFASKQQLLGAVADRVLAPAAATPPAGDWPARITAVATGLRDALLSHT
ncbi:MAG TPA: helix-turn-helix domain-containing protein, partial [Mycolicibacterium fallax]|nr:helix-turn-helix domain-containing protein [Mycolicibacterium fallax]